MNFNQLIYSILGLFLVILSPSYDIVAVFTLIIPWLIIILNNLVLWSDNITADENKSLNDMSFIAILFLIIGMFASRFQPVGFFQIIAFGYYLMLSLLISLSLINALNIKNKYRVINQ